MFTVPVFSKTLLTKVSIFSALPLSFDWNTDQFAVITASVFPSGFNWIYCSCLLSACRASEPTPKAIFNFCWHKSLTFLKVRWLNTMHGPTHSHHNILAKCVAHIIWAVKKCICKSRSLSPNVSFLSMTPAKNLLRIRCTTRFVVTIACWFNCSRLLILESTYWYKSYSTAISLF